MPHDYNERNNLYTSTNLPHNYINAGGVPEPKANDSGPRAGAGANHEHNLTCGKTEC